MQEIADLYLIHGKFDFIKDLIRKNVFLSESMHKLIKNELAGRIIPEQKFTERQILYRKADKETQIKLREMYQRKDSNWDNCQKHHAELANSLPEKRIEILNFLKNAFHENAEIESDLKYFEKNGQLPKNETVEMPLNLDKEAVLMQIKDLKRKLEPKRRLLISEKRAKIHEENLKRLENYVIRQASNS